MAVKIRLQRHGRKGRPFYWIVAADSRTKRDGKFLEKLGTYNPVKNPAIIELNEDSAVKWLKYGAQPSETARRILSYKGVLLKHHLQIGVDKGAITQEQADEKFNLWLEEKNKKINAKKEELSNIKSKKESERLELEKKKALLRHGNSEEQIEDTTEEGTNSESTSEPTGKEESPKDTSPKSTSEPTDKEESPKDTSPKSTSEPTDKEESLKDTNPKSTSEPTDKEESPKDTQKSHTEK